MEQIELITRKHLNTQQLPSGNIYEVIRHDVSESRDILNAWNSVAPGNNSWKIDLLKEVVKLWTTIRTHAFARGWVKQFSSANKKGTRKTLKAIGTVKK